MKNNFTQDFWKKFLKTNENFSQACVIQNALTPELTAILHKGIMEVLINRLTKNDVDQGIRIYLNGKEQEDTYLKSLCHKPPKKNEDIVEYSKRIFDDKFGIIINSGEKHSDVISEKVIECVQPLIELTGLPPLGLEVTIFIGNYGWTPLGIHQDHIGENVLHFHLGPDSKKMYTWEENEYKKLTGTKHNNNDILPLLKHSKEFKFNEGDLYYMPWNKYHVGYTEDLSCAVTVWFNNPSKYKYYNRLMDSFKYQFVKKEMEILPNKFDLLNKNDLFEDFLSVLDVDEDMLNYSVKDFFYFITDEFNYCLASNSGWQNIPISQKDKIGFKVEDYIELTNKSIFSKKQFKILYKIKNNKLVIYVRGSKFEMNCHSELVDIINEINTYKNINIHKLLKKYPDFPQEAVLYFVSLLYDKRGVELLN